MTILRTIPWTVAALALLPLQALAAPSQSNSIGCVYDTLTIEDREMAMLLLFVRYGDSGEERAAWLRGMLVAERLLTEAKAQCRSAHGWSRARANYSRDFAFDTMLVEAARQAIEAEGGHSAAPIDRYFAAKGFGLGRGIDPSSDDGRAFTAYLVEQGWDGEGEGDLKLARKYLDALIKRAEVSRRFAGL